jgi:hypothetical protein
MKHIERLSLIDRIGRELQARMTYSDISSYLAGFGIDTSKQTSGVNSKWVYVKDLLADAPPDVIVRIADELEIPHRYTVKPTLDVAESSFWEANHFRLFISHISTFKKTIGNLQTSLKRYSISAFVAHVDIEPTREWQDEIEAALYSADALAAVLMPGFKESNWTDQEVGIAIGRGLFVVPIIRGLNPYGFIAKYQGLQASSKTVAQVADELFETLIHSPRTRAKLLSCLVSTAVTAHSEAIALQRIDILFRVADLPRAVAEQFRDAITQSSLIEESSSLRGRVNEFLESHELSVLPEPGSEQALSVSDDDIPF